MNIHINIMYFKQSYTYKYFNIADLNQNSKYKTDNYNISELKKKKIEIIKLKLKKFHIKKNQKLGLLYRCLVGFVIAE